MKQDNVKQMMEKGPFETHTDEYEEWFEKKPVRI